MKNYLLPSIRLTLVLIVLFGGLYPLSIFLIGKLAPGHGEGVTIEKNGKIIGFENIGQKFTDDKYFWSRPSAINFNASGSAGSNKATSNPDYLKDVQGRIDTFMKHNPGINKSDIPAELVTASGSGLDPDLSPAGALIQVKRIANKRHLPEEKIRELVEKNTQKPLWGIMGPEKVNVLKLNLALDELK